MSEEKELEKKIEEEMPCCHEGGGLAEKTDIPGVSKIKKDRFLGTCVLVAAAIIGGAWVYTAQIKDASSGGLSEKEIANLEKKVLPKEGVRLPVNWGSLGKQMISLGVIDGKKLDDLYAKRGGLDDETKKMLTEDNYGQPVINKDNANTMLNLLWAVGLANKNEILEKGPMTDKRYGGADRFASTGGWTLSSGKTMNHYSRHNMIQLTAEQQLLVEEVSKNIYRPCCGNSTYFPDCNHGMAMLGLLELMASQGVSEEEMYRVALLVNSFWFPENYMNIAQLLKMKDVDWKDASPKGILSAEYSSSSGYQQVLQKIQPVTPKNGGGSCGV